MKRSLKSFLITTAFSVTTATIFFLLAPIAGSQSELLARTSPTIYDVFIALFWWFGRCGSPLYQGKGNVIPGVAIATALMPPLCTAGYGLASGNLILFPGCFLSLLHQLCFYQSGHFPRSSCDAFPAEGICR